MTFGCPSPGCRPGDFFRFHDRVIVSDSPENQANLQQRLADLERREAEWRQWRIEQDQRDRRQYAAIQELTTLVKELRTAITLQARKTLKVVEAAQYAEVEPATIRRWLADGRLKGRKVGNRQQSPWRIRRKDLDECLERNANTVDDDSP